jgi:hypothetical protein
MKKLSLGFVLMLAFVMMPILVNAAVTGGGPAVTGGGPGTLTNPLNFDSLCGFLKGIFNAAVTIGIPVATLFVVYAGFKFVWARGNSEKLREARNNAMYVAIGIAVFLGAWFLSQVIAKTIQAVGGPSISTCK